MQASKFRLEVDEDLCKGCMYCVEFCPVGALEASNEVSGRGFALPRMKEGTSGMEGCMGCGFCTLICPDLALTVRGVTAGG